MSSRATPSPAMLRRVVAAAVLGNAFEWYDFAIYGLFAAMIAKLYFPAGGPMTSLMLSLATFGVGFAVRPAGGILIGMYGDRVGRKRALSLTITLMATGTGMIGLIPAYERIGIAAPALIVLARMIQGISAGGEFSGATTMLIEFAPAHRRGLLGSFQMCAQALSFLCGAATVWLLTDLLTAAQLESWGWRLPFLFGILIGPLGWLIRARVDESPEFVACVAAKTGAKAGAGGHGEAKEAGSELRDLVTKHARALFASTGVCVVGTVSAYMFVIFLPLFAKQLGVPAAQANRGTFIAMAIVFAVCPLAGHLSDRFGRKAVYLPATMGYGLVAWWLFHRFAAAPSAVTLLTLQAGVACFMGLLWGPMPVILAEVFPAAVRSTAAALAYNVAVLVFGGLAPFVNVWLVKLSGSNLAPIYYVELSVVIGLASGLLLPGILKPDWRTRPA
ncbi:MFS transporter [Paraburkholderia oxyphila]|uniref:MFS transporter n=1 Tax=Paraburkholderia oxyphila TaxID=614212 RepID=UPI000693B58B|nr:MFS transporter [Paraburkholderia oxyphila]